MKFAVIYYSVSGNTKSMAEEIAEGIRIAGEEARLFSIEENVDPAYLEQCKGILFGTPTYVATSHWKMIEWLNHTSGINLSGKLGGCFATAHYAQGGGDTAILSMIGVLLVKGMLIYSGGAAFGQPFIHHGPIALDAVGTHFEDSREMFRIFGERFANKALELF
ncbi:flavodoxin [Enterococcus florum]|uniref:Flavodoxin n=1 Tax=Enterococcus florum TaxID=2480627 RepID=A0A4P5P9T6_9ENTE|nr:flavodoxin domain-containing protein [Enterococcus florum]GCF92252.1 flavodoxin [Enterococcus florum]